VDLAGSQSLEKEIEDVNYI